MLAMTTPTGEWVDRAERSMRLGAIELDELRSRLEALPPRATNAEQLVVDYLINRLERIATRLRQDAAPF